MINNSLKFLILKKIYLSYNYFLIITVNKNLLKIFKLKKKLLENESLTLKFSFDNYNIRFFTFKEISIFFHKSFFRKKFSGLRLVFFFAEKFKDFKFLINKFVDFNLIVNHSFIILGKKKDSLDLNEKKINKNKIIIIFSKILGNFFYTKNFLFFFFKLQINKTLYLFLYNFFKNLILQIFKRFIFGYN